MNISWYLKGREKFIKNALYENLNKILLLLLTFLFISKESSINNYFHIAIISQIIILTFSYKELKSDKINYYFTVRDILKSLKDGKNFLFLSIVGLLHNQISLIMLAIFNVAPIFVGFYSNADKIIKASISFFEPVKNSLFPKFSKKKNRSESFVEIKKLLFSYLPISFIFALIIFFGADKIVVILFNNTSEYASLSLKILAINISFYPVNIFIGNLWILSSGKENINLKIVMLAIILNICISLPLFLKYEYIGVLAGGVVSELVICLLFFMYFIRSKCE